MKDLMWHDFFKIGVDFIDDDHKRILSIIRQVKDAINENDLEKSSLLLEVLIKEAREHFAREEEYLLEVKYPQLENHKIYHNELIIKAEATKAICESNDAEHNIEECIDTLANFLVDDILQGDIGFKSYLEYEGYIK